MRTRTLDGAPPASPRTGVLAQATTQTLKKRGPRRTTTARPQEREGPGRSKSERQAEGWSPGLGAIATGAVVQWGRFRFYKEKKFSKYVTVI